MLIYNSINRNLSADNRADRGSDRRQLLGVSYAWSMEKLILFFDPGRVSSTGQTAPP